MKTIVNKLLLSGLMFTGIFFSATPAFAYTVEKGDTLGEIADEHNTTVKKLTKLNPHIKDVNLIYIGDNIDTNNKNMSTTDADTNSETDTVKEHKDNTKQTASITNSEHGLLAKLVNAEARDESYKGKVAVAEVVLNRVDSDEFPNSIEGVIYQAGQFSPVTNGSINNTPTKEDKGAVKEALQGTNLTNGATFFWNPSIASNRWLDTKPTKAVIGGHEFK